jgi:DNA repair protein RadA/Sms
VGGDAGLSLNSVGGLTSLVADIAARGTPRTRQDGTHQENGYPDDGLAENGRRGGTSAEKNATPARFRRQER